MANTSTDLVSLDPDTNKASLAAFLSGQSIFKSFDFAGSNMSELLSLLSDNTFKNAFYLNMVNAEGWNDSAQLRSSMVSHAKELNYTPRSTTSASATLTVTVPTDGSSPVLVVPKGTTFSGRSGITTFSFSTAETTVYTSSNGTFTVAGLEVFDGVYVSDTFVVDQTDESQRFVMTSTSADTSSVTVAVSEDGGSSVTDYQFKTSLLDVGSTTPAFFLQATDSLRYEILFGNGVIGRAPKNGAVVTVSYRVAAGQPANGVLGFSLNQDVTNGHLAGQVFVSAAGPSAGGAPPESIESIRFNAPRHYQTQERAVGDTDYEDLLREAFPEIEAVAVFGGETFDPPQYGRVFVSINIEGVSGVPDSKQQEYFAFLRPRCVGPIKPIFISPEFLYLRLDSTVDYDVNETALEPSDIETLLMSTAVAFDAANLEDFKVTLRASKLSTALDASHPSIISNQTDILVFKKVVPAVGQAQNISLTMGVPIYGLYPPVPPSHPADQVHAITSTTFTYGGAAVSIEDDGLGNLRLVKTAGQTDSVVKTVGTVDYATGAIALNSFSPDAFDGDSIRIYARPATRDVAVAGNNIFGLDPAEAHFTAVPVSE